MGESVKEFFDGLPGRVDASEIEGMTETYVFDIEGAGTWTVSVENGAVSVADGAGEGNCTISTSEQVFEKMIRGDQNPTMAYMTGKLKVKGDIGAAMKLQKLF